MPPVQASQKNLFVVVLISSCARLLHYRIVLVLHKISYLSSSLMLPIFLRILLLVILSRLLRIICYIAKGTMGELIVMVQADLTYIFGGKGSRRNLGGQRVYNLLIPMWAALLNLIEPSSKSKFLDCVYLGMKQGGAKFFARDKTRDLALWNQLKKKKKKKKADLQKVFTPMTPSVARNHQSLPYNSIYYWNIAPPTIIFECV